MKSTINRIRSGRPRTLNKLTDEDIVNYANYNVMVAELAMKHHVSIVTIYNWLNGRGIKRDKSKANKLTDEDIANYKIGTNTVIELAVKHCVSTATVYKWLRGNVKKRIKSRINKLTDEDIADYKRNKTNQLTLAMKHGVYAYLIRRWLIDRGVEIHRGRKHVNITPNPYEKQNKEIFNAYQYNVGVGVLASTYKLSRQRIYQIVQRQAQLLNVRLRKGHQGKPLTPNRLTYNDIDQYVNRMTSVAKLSKKHHAGFETINRWLIEKNVEINGNKFILTDIDIDDYKNKRISSVAIAKRRGVGYQTILKALRALNIEIYKSGWPKGKSRTNFELTTQDIDDYKSKRASSTTIAQRHNTTYQTVLTKLRQLGVSTWPPVSYRSHGRFTTPTSCQNIDDRVVSQS